ncbi:MAG: hypothetical protein Q9212_003977 [Teloschistes hypoglaucus]
MRVFLGFIWAPLLLAARSAASDAQIYITDQHEGRTPKALSPATIRLLLARRLGLSQYHSLEGVDESALKLLNNYGGEQRALFSADEQQQQQDRQRNLIVIDGVEDSNGLLPPSLHMPEFTLSDPPHSSYTRQLVEDLERQAQDATLDGQKRCGYTPFEIGQDSRGSVTRLSADGTCLHRERGPQISRDLDTIAYWTSILEDLASAIPSRTAIIYVSLSNNVDRSQKTSKALEGLSKVLSRLLESKSNHETTIMLMPRSDPKAKRTTASPYGNGIMPDPKKHEKREGQSEAPLTAPSEPKTSLSSHHVSVPQTLKASSVPRVGILPVCQPKLDILIAVTNNCSGHGTPYLKRHGSSPDDDVKIADCYACKCGKTVLDRGEGKGVKTVVWAGPACSKKDVSGPFWLLAGISIALVATVTWGIGLMFSIGQEELPSVIGAGVAGPRAQK